MSLTGWRSVGLTATLALRSNPIEGRLAIEKIVRKWPTRATASEAVIYRRSLLLECPLKFLIVGTCSDPCRCGRERGDRSVFAGQGLAGRDERGADGERWR